MPGEFVEFARGLDAPELGFALAALAAVAAFAGWRARTALARARLLEDTPTSLIRSAAQGYCELAGHADLMGGAPVRAPLTAIACVWWDYRVEEKVSSGKNREWRTVESDTSGALFALDDRTGRCVVDPDRAEVVPSCEFTWYGDSPRPLLGPENGARWGLGHSHRYTERRIADRAELHALGWFQTEDDPYDGSDEQREVALMLAGWKRDQAALLAHFDADHDGRIDMQEWEAARQAAQREVRAQTAARAQSVGVNLMKAPRDGRPFILSTLPQAQLAGRLRWRAAGWFGVATLAVATAVEMLAARGA